MCDQHKSELLTQALAIAEENHDLYLEALGHYDNLDYRLQDLLDRFVSYPTFTEKQAAWIRRSLPAIEEITPLYGDFKAIHVMFRLAAGALKRPKIRLVTKDDTFIQLTFIQDDGESSKVLVHKGGWSGHGRRVYLGQIDEGLLKPKFAGAFEGEIYTLLQEFSLDPMAVAKASANKLGACSFCAQRLTDPESKEKGYGPVCAEHFGLPWGKRTEAVIAQTAKIREMTDLSQLF